MAIFGSSSNPLGSVLCPLVPALVAGNAVIIKPSSRYPKVATALKLFLKEYLDTRLYSVADNTIETGIKLSQEKLDLIYFTGREATAKLISKEASAQLTPLVLQTEGRLVAVIDSCSNMTVAVNK